MVLRGDPRARSATTSSSACATSSTRARRTGSTSSDCVEIASIFERTGTDRLLQCHLRPHGHRDRRSPSTTCPAWPRRIAPWLEPVGAFKREVEAARSSMPPASPTSRPRATPSREGLLDMVAMTRAHIADPHHRRARLQRGREDRDPALRRRHPLPVALPARAACTTPPPAARRACRTSIDALAARRAARSSWSAAGRPASKRPACRPSAATSVVLFEAADRLGGQVLMAPRARAGAAISSASSIGGPTRSSGSASRCGSTPTPNAPTCWPSTPTS